MKSTDVPQSVFRSPCHISPMLDSYLIPLFSSPHPPSSLSPRNDANLLVQRKAGRSDVSLVPIDHGYCLPDTLEVAWCDWVWLDWPQTKVPLDDEEKVRDSNAELTQ